MCYHYPGIETEVATVFNALPAVFNDLSRSGLLGNYYDKQCNPLYPVATIRLSDDDRWHVQNRTWGLLPHSWKPSAKFKSANAFQRGHVNARSETIHTSWPWKMVFRQRCVMLASGFCEPAKEGGGEMLYTLPDHELFAIPALHARYRGDDGKGNMIDVDSVVMLTTEPNELVASTRGGQRIRQPVVLTESKDIRRYCSPESVEHSQLNNLFAPVPSEMMQYQRV